MTGPPDERQHVAAETNGRYNVERLTGPRIREMPASERPRERLRDAGAGALQTAELLAIILRTGTARLSALALAQSLLAKHNGLAGLARLSYADLKRENGIGEAKAAEIMAAIQLAIRYRDLGASERFHVSQPAHVYALLGAEMAALDQEHLRVLLVDTRNRLMGTSEVYIGTVNQAQVRGAEVLREAVRQNAPAIILVHNHPSGDPSPSPEDIAMTKKVIEAGKQLDIDVMDHIIIGERKYASLQELGYI
jgi:DNA repair protein RadC